jgi:hypothetical protein
MLGMVYRCVLLGIRARRADGLPFNDLQELARALYRAHDMSLKRHEVDTDSDTSPCWDDQSACDWCDTAEASALLGCSRRQIQRMARATGPDAIQVGRIWMLRRAPLLVLATERRARDRRTDGVSIELAAARHAAVVSTTQRGDRACD